MRLLVVLALMLPIVAPTSTAAPECFEITNVDRDVPETGHRVKADASRCTNGPTFERERGGANVSKDGSALFRIDASATRTGARTGAHGFNETLELATPIGATAVWYESYRSSAGYTTCRVSGFVAWSAGTTTWSSGSSSVCVPQEAMLP